MGQDGPWGTFNFQITNLAYTWVNLYSIQDSFNLMSVIKSVTYRHLQTLILIGDAV